MVTAFLHLFFMAAFSWMLVEGLLLWSKVVAVNMSEDRRMKFYYLTGWGIYSFLCIGNSKQKMCQFFSLAKVLLGEIPPIAMLSQTNVWFDSVRVRCHCSVGAFLPFYVKLPVLQCKLKNISIIFSKTKCSIQRTGGGSLW